MKTRSNFTFRTKAVSLLLVLSFMLSFTTIGGSAAADDTVSGSGDTAAEQSGAQTNSAVAASDAVAIAETYLAVSAGYSDPASYGLTDSNVVTLQASAAVSASGTPLAITQNYQGYSGASVLSDKAADTINWNIDIPKTGLYEINIDYLPFDSDKSDIQRKILIDGEEPFQESGNIGFLRKWKELSEPKLDKNGDEIVPKLGQELIWETNTVSDVNGMYPTPLRYLLTAGSHTFSLQFVNADLNIGTIVLKPAGDYKSYAEVKTEYAQKGYKEYAGSEPVRVEGESADYRSAQILRRESNSDPATYPYKIGHTILNVVGGFNWRKGNQTVEWKLTVPESGLYKLNARIFQNHGEGLNVYRQITIDGEVPFTEVAAYAFGFSNNWQSETISDADGNPYLFYLEKGEHTLAFSVKMGGASEIINELMAINNDMSALIRNITKITGSDPDLNFDYKLEQKVPTLIDDMKNVRDRYQAQVDYLLKISKKTPTLANSLKTAADQLNYLIEHPNKIPAKLDELTTTQTSVSTWYFNIQDQPIQLDYVQLLAPAQDFKMRKSNFWDKISGTTVNFIASFYKDYDSVPGTEESTANSDVVLDIWVARSKEMCEVLQRMANEDFTPATGIGVKINVLPSGSVGAVGSISPLMLAIISGKVPDVALGSDSLTPVELAIRGAAYDLKNFSDYDEVSKRFIQGTITPMEYRGGVYALPENIDFKMMFYRTDILEEIGLTVPDTWEELYNKVLPILDQNAMQFYMASDYTTFLFQNGGDYYSADGMKTLLGNDVGYRSFLQWCKNYTVYDFPKTADIYNHFRIGDLPLVIGGYADYIKIMYAAPDLYGRWNIAPIPGIKKDDGTIDRTSGGASTTICMFTDSKYKEGAWEFTKWWLSADVQYLFSVEIEAIMGLEARWNTANEEAFLRLPWNTEHVPVFEEAWKWFKNQPNVLGGYYTTRNVNNAWTRVVMNDVNPRTSWEKAVDDIKSEMERKQIEYGFAEATAKK